MSRVSTFTRFLCVYILAAQVHAATIPPALLEPRPTIRPQPIDPIAIDPIRPIPIDPILRPCITSTLSIGCGNNACQSAWATAFTTSNAYVRSFCSSFTAPDRRNTFIFDRKGPASVCVKGLGNAAIQSSISSVCSCYAGSTVPTQAVVTICPRCPPIPPIRTRTITTSVPTTVFKTTNGSIKTITTVITLVVDPPFPIRTIATTTTTKTATQTITTNSSGIDLAPCTTSTNVLTTTLVTAIYDYFTMITTTTTTYQAGRYPCATTICTPQPASTITIRTPYCNQISERTITTTITSTVTAGLPFPFPSPPSPPASPPPISIKTVTIIVDPLPVIRTVTVSVSVTAGLCSPTPVPLPSPIGGVEETVIDEGGLTLDEGLWPVSMATVVGDSGSGSGSGSDAKETETPVIIDDGGFTARVPRGTAVETGKVVVEGEDM